MTAGADLTRLVTAPRASLTIAGFRNLSPRYDPRSGEGARIHGGRFNPPNSFPTFYLCETRECALAELTRQGTRNVVGVEGLLPRSVYQYDLRMDRVLDLTDEATLAHLGLTPPQLVSDDWSLCQEIGVAAHAGGDQAIRSPSATGVDNIVAVFSETVGTSLKAVELTETWAEIGDLDLPS